MHITEDELKALESHLAEEKTLFREEDITVAFSLPFPSLLFPIRRNVSTM